MLLKNDCVEYRQTTHICSEETSDESMESDASKDYLRKVPLFDMFSK